uniref:RING-type domain-containing protein n=1 Tax=Oreochromis aureus TaxID=47969 RepID=A0A668TZ86_OREAU
YNTQRISYLKKFSCSICIDLLKDPVAIPCGHSYCMSCIKTHWDTEDPKRKYSCPQCRKTFTPRPLLEKNIMLTDLVEELKKTGFQELYQKQKQKELELRRLKIQETIQDREKDVKLLQQEAEVINGSADKAVEYSQKIFTELIRLIKKRRNDVKQQIRCQQESELGLVRELQEKLEQEITELKRMDEELEQLSHTDHEQLLHNYPSLSYLFSDCLVGLFKKKKIYIYIYIKYTI